MSKLGGLHKRSDNKANNFNKVIGNLFESHNSLILLFKFLSARFEVFFIQILLLMTDCFSR